MVLAALFAGGFATTFMLWVTAFGGSNGMATARLSRLRDTEQALPQETRVSLRRRGSVNFAGITVISGNLAANWTRDLERAGLALKRRSTSS